MIKTWLVAAAMVCVTAPAGAQSSGTQSSPNRPPPCLRVGNIYDFQLVPGNRSLVVQDISRTRYRVNFMGRCYDLKYNFGLAFRTFGTGELSCVGRGDSVYNNQAFGAGRQCIVKSVEYQTRALDQMDYNALRTRDDRPAPRNQN
jgi:hypothetical protein